MNICTLCGERPAVATIVVPGESGVQRQSVCYECQQDGFDASARGRPKVAVGSLFGKAYAGASFDTFRGEESFDFFTAFNRKAPSGVAQYTAPHLSALSLIRDEAEAFAKMLAGGTPGRMFLSGGPGSGKTHLLASTCRLLLDAGQSVTVVSAYDFVSEMLSMHGSRPASERQLQSDLITSLAAHDAVVVDDLNPEIITDSTPRYIGWLFMELVRRDTTLLVASQLTTKQLSQERIGTKPGLGEGVMDRLSSSPSAVLRLPTSIPSFRTVQQYMSHYGE